MESLGLKPPQPQPRSCGYRVAALLAAARSKAQVLPPSWPEPPLRTRFDWPRRPPGVVRRTTFPRAKRLRRTDASCPHFFRDDGASQIVTGSMTIRMFGIPARLSSSAPATGGTEPRKVHSTLRLCSLTMRTRPNLWTSGSPSVPAKVLFRRATQSCCGESPVDHFNSLSELAWRRLRDESCITRSVSRPFTVASTHSGSKPSMQSLPAWLTPNAM